VGIITPYVDQLKLLQREFAAEREAGLTIRTCDGFQGGEREYIFISLVRSNPEGNIGFCGEESRINVSITRARRGMMIVGSAGTFVSTPNYWGAIAQYLHTQNAYF
jgi:superfamily I DNA and/or RNA helicase